MLSGEQEFLGHEEAATGLLAIKTDERDARLELFKNLDYRTTSPARL